MRELNSVVILPLIPKEHLSWSQEWNAIKFLPGSKEDGLNFSDIGCGFCDVLALEKIKISFKLLNRKYANALLANCMPSRFS